MKYKALTVAIRSRPYRMIGGVVSAPALLATVAMAQEVPPPPADTEQRQAVLDTITVTSTRRASTTQDLPQAVTAVDGATIERTGAVSLESFSRLDPSLQVNNRGIGDNQVIVRGISSSGKPTVGLYYDETPLVGFGMDGGSDGQPNVQLHDIERVEVLKGPQGTLFGAGSMSGTLRFITNKPDLSVTEASFAGRVGAVRGGNPLYQAQAVLNAPFVEDRVGMRAVVWGDTGGGYIDQTRNGETTRNVNDHGVWGGRFTLASQMSDRLRLTLAATRQKSNADGSQYYEYDAGAYNNVSPTLEPFEDEIDIFSAVADYTFDSGTLTVSTSYMERWLQYARDSTPTAIRFNIPAALAFSEGQTQDNWASEVRFASDLPGPLQYVVGGFYSEQEAFSDKAAIIADQTTGVGPCSFYADCLATGNSVFNINSGYDDYRIEQYALFAQGSFDFTPRLTGTLGVRYYEADISERSVSTQALRFPTSPIQVAPVVQLNASSSEDKLSYNAALAFDLTPDTMLYARAASGFRPGGNNDAASAAQYGVNVPDAFESDTLWNYEIGAKSYFLDRRAYVEASLYRIDWSNQQISVTDPGGTFIYIANAGESRVNGAELSFHLRPVPGLNMNVGATWTDAKLSEDLPATSQTVGLAGDRIPYSPEWSLSGQAEYEFPLSGRYWGYVGTHLNYRSDSYTDFNAQNDNYQRLDSYFLIGANAGVRFDDWDVGVFVENLTDAEAEIGLRVTGDGYRVYGVRPLTAGLAVRARF